jgi:hypothetical protein
MPGIDQVPSSYKLNGKILTLSYAQTGPWPGSGPGQAQILPAFCQGQIRYLYHRNCIVSYLPLAMLRPGPGRVVGLVRLRFYRVIAGDITGTLTIEVIW